MGLVKRTYVDGETVITADNLNDIQDEIIQNASDISTKGTYSKPSGGIPSTDMTTAVQTSLDKADTALQSSDIDNTLSVTGKAADAKKTGDEISGVKNTLNHKADAIYDTASGDIASFPDGADGLPVKDLTVGIEPVQDLHGWDYPFPPGISPNIIYNGTDTSNGYENKKYLKEDGSTGSANDNNISEYFPVSGSTVYTISQWTANMNAASVGFYDSSKAFISGEAFSQRSSFQITSPANAAYCRITLSAADHVQMELGSTPSDYMPYSNICPISGWTGANVIGVGEAFSGFEQGALNANGMNSASNTRIRTKNYIPVVPGKTYYIHAFPTVSGKITQVYIYFYDKADYSTNKKDRIGWLQLPTTFTVPNDSMYIRFGLSYVSGENVNPSNFNPVFLWPNNEKTSITISWQSSAGTVYGGTLDVTSGVLKLTHSIITSFSRGGKDSSDKLYIIANNISANVLVYDPSVISSMFPVLSLSDARASTSPCLCLYGTTLYAGGFIGKESELDTILASGDLQVVYPRAAALVIQLDPVTMTTLLGQNNIWADTGDSTVEYPADTKLYIDKKLAALVAALS